MSRLADRTILLTDALLVASMALIGPSLLDLGASIPLVALLFALAAALFLGRDALGAVGPVPGLPVGSVLRVSWAGILLAAVVSLVSLGASAGELQALGGFCGLAGMLNYFLRPVYAAVIAVARYVDRTVGGTADPDR